MPVIAADDDHRDADEHEAAPLPVAVKHEADAGDRHQPADDVVVALAEELAGLGPLRADVTAAGAQPGTDDELEDVGAEPRGDRRDVGEQQQVAGHGSPSRRVGEHRCGDPVEAVGWVVPERVVGAGMVHDDVGDAGGLVPADVVGEGVDARERTVAGRRRRGGCGRRRPDRVRRPRTRPRGGAPGRARPARCPRWSRRATDRRS